MLPGRRRRPCRPAAVWEWITDEGIRYDLRRRSVSCNQHKERRDLAEAGSTCLLKYVYGVKRREETERHLSDSNTGLLSQRRTSGRRRAVLACSTADHSGSSPSTKARSPPVRDRRAESPRFSLTSTLAAAGRVRACPPAHRRERPQLSFTTEVSYSVFFCSSSLFFERNR
jgi:hypothetical protein